MDLLRLIDLAAPEPVIVTGSLPPAGRDIDLLVRPAAQSALARWLTGNGFHARGHMWARFAACGAQVVELIPTSTFGVQAAALEQLYDEARPIDGLTSLLRPAAHHRLLLVARRVAAEAGLRPKAHAAALQADGAAWRLAREAAPGWGAQRALAELAHALDGHPPRSWMARSATARARGYRPGVVIAISGVDGSGKSTQADGLQRALTTLGYPAVIVWTSLAGHALLSRVAAPARALMGVSARRWSPDAERPPAGEDRDPLTCLRERRRWLHMAWVSFVAAMNAWWQARAVRSQMLRGRVVICDRYTLDSLVQLRYRYGEQHSYRAQLALIRLLSPRPLRAYLLDVTPAGAYARNREFTPRQVEQRVRLYREEQGSLGVIRLDGERPGEELCACIALDVWSAMENARR